MRARRLAFTGFLGLASLLVFLFLFIPVAAIFGRIPPGQIWDQLGTQVVQDALRISAEVNGLSLLLLLGFGTPAAYFLATRRFPGRSIVITLVELPLVLPPAVAGIGLLVAFLPDGPIGRVIHPLGYDVIFRESAVVISVLFVSSPFYLRAAIAAFEGLDEDVLAAARTLGANPRRVFMHVAIPLAMPGLGAGAALAFARGVGEFGATIMFAGSLEHVTQTLPLAIYAEFATSFDVALAIGGVMVAFSFILLLVVKWLRFGWTSPSRFAPSTSV
jgi:molybdate transport system permease protein